MPQEQSIRVTAKGDFTQLQRGLKQLQGDLRNVTGEINRGARKGGFFDDSQIRALDFFGKRFKSTLQEMKDALREHGHAYERLLSQSRQAHGAEKEMFEKEIRNREKIIDKIEDQIQATEKLYRQRRKDADEFGNKPAQGGGSGGGGGRESSGLVGGLLGMGKFALGMAGVGGIAALAYQSYGLAQTRAISSLDLSQRMRGRNGWNQRDSGDMWDSASAIGRQDRMGYSASDTWGMLDMYTRMAGGIGGDQLGGLMKFGRGYGLGTSEVASMAGGNRALGGTGTPKEFADAIAGSVETSGMTPRIMEVMETNNALLQQMNTTLKDGSAQQILAYQTTLDRIGMAKGMMQLTGSQGANIIGGLGGIYNSSQGNDWKWMGIRALQQYDPKKYNKMGLFDLEKSFEDGLLNTDNVPAMAGYMKKQSGGNKSLTIRMFQKWLADGGTQLSKTAVSDLYDATGGLSSFSKDQLESLKNGSVDSGAKYDATRKDASGQAFMDTDARFEHAMEQIGRPIVEAVYTLKDGITTAVEPLTNDMTNVMEATKGILAFLEEHWKELATFAGVAIVASNVLKVAAAVGMAKGLSGGGLVAWLGRLAIPAAVAYAIAKPEETTAAVSGGLDATMSATTGLTKDEAKAKVDAQDEALKKADPKAWAKIQQHKAEGYSPWDEFKDFIGVGDDGYKKYMPTSTKDRARDRKEQALAGGIFLPDTSATPDASADAAPKDKSTIQKYYDWVTGLFGAKQDAGDSALGHFEKASVRTFDDWRRDSQKSISTMEIKSKTTMDAMDKYTSEGFNRIYEEHKGIKTMLYEIFQPVADFLMGNTTPGSVGGDTSGGVVTPGNGSGVGSFFKGWQGRVTSRFGAKESFRKKPHGGLDINGEQGDALDALAGGAVQFIYMDDGGKLDADHKKNTRAGGTEVGIRMPDGRTYFYSHMSGVNPALKVGGKVGKGDWLGNLGGTPGVAGSGNSTTGSHLHLGYMDPNGTLMNPEELLSGLNAGDSSIGTMTSSKVRKSELKVTFDVTGEGADRLNKTKGMELEAIVRKIVAENERQKLSVQPTKMGWNL